MSRLVPKPLFVLLVLFAPLAVQGSTVQVGEHGSQHAMAVTSKGDVEEQALESLQKPGVKLAVKHISKMGGSFMINLLNEMTTRYPRDMGRKFFPKYFEEYPSEHNQFFALRDKYWVMAGVRNPCDWYVSQWAFASKFDNNTMHKKFGKDFFGDLLNQSKFNDWMHWAMAIPSQEPFQDWLEYHHGAHPGALSVRFWESFVGGRSDYIPPAVSPKDVYDSTLLDDYSRTYAGRPDVAKSIRAFQPLNKVDCWVRHENYKEELRQCLNVYEMISGTQLDWLPFDRIFERKEQALSTNPSTHGPCESYYTPELAAAVRTLDKGLFDAFNYPACCGPATGPMMTRGSL